MSAERVEAQNFNCRNQAKLLPNSCADRYVYMVCIWYVYGMYIVCTWYVFGMYIDAM